MSNSIRAQSSIASFQTAKSHQSSEKHDSADSIDLNAPITRDFALQPLAIPARTSSRTLRSPPATASSPGSHEDVRETEFELQPLMACFDRVQDQRNRVTEYLTLRSFPKSQPRTAATEAARHDLAGELQKLLELERPIGHLRLELVDPRHAYHEETVRLLIQLGFTGFVSRGPGSVPETWKAGRCPFFPDSMRVHDVRSMPDSEKHSKDSAGK